MNKIIQGDTLQELKKIPDNLVNTIITSPPYWGLIDYGEETNVIWEGKEKCQHQFEIKEEKNPMDRGGKGQHDSDGIVGKMGDKTQTIVKSGFCPKCGAWYGQLGLEPTLKLYLKHLSQITIELKRVLKPTGVMFWNHGDSYATISGSGKIYGNIMPDYEEKIKSAGLRHSKKLEQQGVPRKSLFLQNYRLILQMIDQGWILRNTIIWNKPNHMPSSVKDRFTNSYEPVFMLVKKKHYWFDLDAVRKPHTTFENRPMGIIREREFGYNTEYPQIRQTKIPQAQAESFGNPRARQHRKQDNVPGRNAPMYKGFNERWEKSQKFITPEQQKETQEKTGWIEGSGRVRSFYDNFGGETNPKGKNPGDVWTIPTQPFPEAHFATFPEKLIEPMILSSCPKEICKKCGRARERIIKLGEVVMTGGSNKGKLSKSEGYVEGREHHGHQFKQHEHKTLGWTDCNCKAGWKSGIVLDPFIGSGTVAVVAKRLGRNYLGIELKEDYIKIAEQRIKAQPTPLL